MKFCASCGKGNYESARFCSTCGKPFGPNLTNQSENLQQTPAPPTSTQTTKNKTPIILIILIVVVCIGASCLFYSLFLNTKDNNRSSSNSSGYSGGSSLSDTYSVEYQVGGSTYRASLTFQNETGSTEQDDVGVPWSKKFTASSNDFLYISAQNESDMGFISCKILVDDKIVKEADSDADYGIATCSGTLP